MAGRSDIQAGHAFVRLSLKNQMYSGLIAAQAQLTAFGGALKTFGAFLTGAGTAMLGPLGAAVTQFARTGDAIEKMAIRTGIGTAALSELGFAAEASDASLDDVATGIKNMQKLMVSAAAGTKDALKSIVGLRISLTELKKMDVEGQFEEFAAAIADLKSPAERSAAAMAVFGKSGQQLLPLLVQGREGIEELREEAKALGRSIDPADARAAAELGDAWGRVRSAFTGATFSIGGALAPALTRTLGLVQNITSSTAAWIRQNKEMVTWAAKLGVGTVATGVATFGLGKALQAAGSMVGAFKTAISPLVDLSNTLRTTFVGIVNQGAGQLTKLTRGLADAGRVAATLATTIGTSLASGLGRLATLGATATVALANGFMNLARTVTSFAASALARLPSVASAAASGVGAVFNRIGQYIVAIIPQSSAAATILQRTWQIAGRAIERSMIALRTVAYNAWADIRMRAAQQMEQVRLAISRQFDRMSPRWQAFVAQVSGAFARVQAFVQPVTSRIATAWGAMAAVLGGAIRRVSPLVREDFNRFVGFARLAAQQTIAAFRGVGPQIAAGIRTGMRGAFAGVGGLGRGLSGGLMGIAGIAGTLGAGLGGTLGTIATVLPSVLLLTASLGALINPATLFVAAIAGGVVAWTRFSDSGQKALSSVMSFMAPFIDTARRTIRGISDAFTAGDLSLAGQIAITGLKLIFAEGMGSLSTMVSGVMGDTIGTITGQILSGDLTGAWATAVKGMAAIWDAWSEGVVATFTAAAREVTELWSNVVQAISNKMLELAAQGGIVGKAMSAVLGVDVEAEVKRGEALGQKDILAQGRDSITRQVGGTADSINSTLNDIEKAARAQTESSSSALAEGTKRGSSILNDAIEAARRDLDKLTADARAKAAQTLKDQAAVDTPGAQVMTTALAKSAGTFSSAGAIALGQGGNSPQERVVKAVESQSQKLEKIAKISEQMLEQQRATRLQFVA